MLKITFTETGLWLEPSTEPLETVVAERVKLHACARRPLMVQPTTASIPFPQGLPGLHTLARFAEVELVPCDRHWVEVTLSGLWIAEEPDQAEGIFLADLRPHLEQRILSLWHLAQQTQFTEVASSVS